MMEHPDHLNQVFLTLFLSFLVSAEGINADAQKVKTIKDWPIPKTLTEVCSFHGFATLHHFTGDLLEDLAPLWLLLLIARDKMSFTGLLQPLGHLKKLS